jgi:hypothetical protein
MDMKNMTFVMACKQHFGYKDGQTLQEFSQELKQLTEQDKNDLIIAFRSIGIDATKQTIGK